MSNWLQTIWNNFERRCIFLGITAAILQYVSIVFLFLVFRGYLEGVIVGINILEGVEFVTGLVVLALGALMGKRRMRYAGIGLLLAGIYSIAYIYLVVGWLILAI